MGKVGRLTIIGASIFIVIVLMLSFELYKSKYTNINSKNTSGLQAKDNKMSKKTDFTGLTIPKISGLEGGYFPLNNIIIEGYKFICIIITANTDDKIDGIEIEIKDSKEKSFVKFYPCVNFSVESNKLILQPTTTIIGDISFNGFFLPVKNGEYANVSDRTVVLKGKLVITKNGKSVYQNNKQEFTFFYGD